MRYFNNPKTGKMDAVAGSDVNRYLKENGLTNNRGTYWRDAGGNAYDLPDGMDEDAWLKEWEAVGNPLTRAEDGHNRADYAEEVYKYRTPKGDVSVRMGDDGAFRKEYAATFGGVPERLSSRIFNGVLLSGPQSALLNLASVTQGDGLTAEQLKSLGATDDDLAHGAERTKDRLLSRDKEVKRRLGRVGFLENEMRNRALKESGAEATGGASMMAAYGQAAADVMTKPLNIVGLGMVSLRDFGDMALQYGGEDGLKKLKERGAVQAWLDRWRLMGWRGMGLRGMGRDPFTDEQWHEIFKEGLRKIKRNERLDEIRGQTWGAKIGSGAIDMAEYSGEMAMDGLLAATVGAPLGAVGTVSSGLVGGTLAHEAMGLTNEVKRQMADKVMFNPATGKVEKVVAGRDFWSALGHGATNLGVEYVGEQVGGKVAGVLTKPLKAVASKIVGREMSVLLGMMPGVVSKPKGMIGRGLQKSARAWNRFASNPWAKAVSDLTGIRQMTPSGLLEEMTEEVVQNFLGETFNLSGDRLTEDGQIAGTSLAEGGLAAWETLKQAPEFAAQMALYSLGMGLGTRGVRAMTRGYGTRATLRNALRGAGYTDARLKGMDREAMQEAFANTYMRGGDEAETAVELAYGRKGSSELFAEVSRLGRVQATPNEGFTELDTVDGDGNAVKVKGAQEVKDWLLGQLKAEARENGFAAVSVGIAQDAVTRGAMFLAKEDLDEARRTMREMGMDAAFANFGNSGGVYDAFAEALAMRMVAHSSAYEGTTMGAFLEAMGKGALVSAMDTMEEAKVSDGDVLATMQAYERYVAGAEVERRAVGENVPKVFDAEGRDVPWLDGTDGSQSMSKDGVTIRHKPDGAYTVWVDGRGRRVARTVNGVPVIVRAQSAKRYFPTADEAVAEANKLHAQVEAYERRQAALREQAVRMYDETFGNAAGTERNMALLGSVFEDDGVFNELLNALLSKGMGRTEALRALVSVKGAKLADGSFAVFLDNMDSIADLAATIRHEGFHVGLSTMMDGMGEDALKAFVEEASRLMDGRLVNALGVPISAEMFNNMDDLGKEVALDEALAQLAELRARKPSLSGRIALLVNGLFNKDGRLGGLRGRALEEEARKIVNAAFFRVRERRGAMNGAGRTVSGRAVEEVPGFRQEAEAERGERGASTAQQNAEPAPQTEAQESQEPNASSEAPAPTPPSSVVELINDPEAHVETVPVAEVKVNDRIPQFKKGADPRTGVVRGSQLQGEFSPTVTRPIRVMLFKDGAMEVITGRHRLDLARRNGLKEIKAYVYSEADGMTVEKARALDAAENIMDGKGSVQDFVRFFEDTKLTREELARLGISNSENRNVRNAFAIATNAVDEVRSRAMEEGGKVPFGMLGAIAESPKRLQLALLDMVLNGKLKDAGAVRFTGKAMEQSFGESMAGEQADLFGSNDAALEESRLLGIGQAAKARELRHDMDMLSAVLRRERNVQLRDAAATRLGIKDKHDRAELQRVYDALKAEAAEWESATISGARRAEALALGRKLEGAGAQGAEANGTEKRPSATEAAPAPKEPEPAKPTQAKDGRKAEGKTPAPNGKPSSAWTDGSILNQDAIRKNIDNPAFMAIIDKMKGGDNGKTGEKTKKPPVEAAPKAQAPLIDVAELDLMGSDKQNAWARELLGNFIKKSLLGQGATDGEASIINRALSNLTAKGIIDNRRSLKAFLDNAIEAERKAQTQGEHAYNPAKEINVDSFDFGGTPAQNRYAKKIVAEALNDVPYLVGSHALETFVDYLDTLSAREIIEKKNGFSGTLKARIDLSNGGHGAVRGQAGRQKAKEEKRATIPAAPRQRMPMLDEEAGNALEAILREEGLFDDEAARNPNVRFRMGQEERKRIRAEVTLPDTPMTPYEAKRTLLALKGRWFVNRETDDEATFNVAQINKIVSNRAAQKSVLNGFTRDQHNQAAARIGTLFENASLVEKRGDKNGDANISRILRFAAPVIVGGETCAAYITVKESVEGGERIYSLEMMELETLGRTIKALDNQRPFPVPSVGDIIAHLRDKVNVDETNETPDARFRMGAPGKASSKLLNNLSDVFYAFMERDKHIRTFEALAGAVHAWLGARGQVRAWEALKPYLRNTWNTIGDMNEDWGLEEVSRMAANATLTRIEKRGSDILKTSPNGGGTSTKEQSDVGTGIQRGSLQGGGGVAEGAVPGGERLDGSQNSGLRRDGRGLGRANDELSSGLGGDEPALRVADGDGGAEGGHQGRGERASRGRAEAGARGVDVVPGVGGDGGLRAGGAAAQPAGAGVDNGADAGAGGVREGTAAQETVLTPKAAGEAAKVAADRAVAKAQPAKNYVIPEENDGISGLRDKRSHAEANLAALRVLRTLRDEGRLDKATPEEQAILSRYAGWGGVAEAFDETKGDWAEAYAELKGLLP